MKAQRVVNMYNLQGKFSLVPTLSHMIDQTALGASLES